MSENLQNQTADFMQSFTQICKKIQKFQWQDQAKMINLLNSYFDIKLKNEKFKANYRRTFPPQS